jgi:hypothetical protein
MPPLNNNPNCTTILNNPGNGYRSEIVSFLQSITAFCRIPQIKKISLVLVNVKFLSYNKKRDFYKFLKKFNREKGQG